MICRFEELKCKEIINIRSGKKMGYADDIEFDTCTAKICKLIICGKSRFFGLFGREEDCAICWSDVEMIGEDAILVSCEFPNQPKGFGGRLKNLLK
ncbi:MAG: YlmC/YmxH family sporulation protein [Bacteroides sp.]|nr:YlmC/YmxH family sporulation protein [Eubacterium sp.]MCM1418099.1 YlmC/YmxH family sporulation protein [Roseburia sp.]MCM1462277.1 YlmC/YmxH family sporulation protein [Bacteroides sp.]